MEFAKILRFDAPSPTAFVGMVKEHLEILGPKEKKPKDEVQWLRLQNATAKEPLV